MSKTTATAARADHLIDVACGAAPAAKNAQQDRRDRERQPYEASVNLLLLTHAGAVAPLQLLKAKDISAGGLCLRSRNMIHPGQRGAVQLVRSDGSLAVVGVQVLRCLYVGNMTHDIGMRFVDLPAGVTAESFIKANALRSRGEARN